MRRWTVRLVGIFTLLVVAGIGAPAAAGGGCRTPAGTVEGTGQAVSIKNCSFGPTILRAPVGATVTWLNEDHVPHAVNGMGWDAIDPYTSANPGARMSHTFSTAGIYPYMCYVHPGMSGVIIVGDAASFPAATVASAAPSAAAASAAPSAAAAPPAPRVDSATATSTPLPALALLVAGAALGYLASLLRRVRMRPLASA